MSAVVVVLAVFLMSCIILCIVAAIVWYNTSDGQNPSFINPVVPGTTPPSGPSGPPSGPPSPSGMNSGPPNAGSKPLIFLNLTGHGDANNGRLQDAIDMAQGKGWEYVSENIDGWNINPANTHEPWKVLAAVKKRPTWILHENDLSASLMKTINPPGIVPYQKWIEETGVPHKIYGHFILFDLDPFGRRFEPGVVTKWKNTPPFSDITKTIFSFGRGGEITNCLEAYCEDDFSALRESDGFLYEQNPSFLNAAHGNRGVAGEWPGHRDAWRKLFGLIKKYGANKKVIWLMATTGAGSLRDAQESFRWMKSEGLVPDVIIVANYGVADDEPANTARKKYRSIPEGKGDDYPDTTCGIARWLLMNR
jgi:hypothetical protein